MIEIGKTIVSFDILEERFLCDLLKCRGACCVDGDAGAPLTVEEAGIMQHNYESIAPCMSAAGRQAVQQQGIAVTDREGDLVTSLIDNRECAFSFPDEHGITKCAVEKAFLEGRLEFRKPLSCHLFPIRITKYKRFEAVNYQQLEICAPGRQCGQGNILPLYVFLKEPLIRKYGAHWYDQLSAAATHMADKRTYGAGDAEG